MRLEGKLIRLRAVEPDDVEPMYRWENDPAVWHVSGTLAPFSRHQLQRFVDEQQFDIYQTRQMRLIIEALDETHRRMPAFAADKITSLADIAMYTDADDVPLHKVLTSLKELEQGKPASIDYRKASGDELREYFAKVLPDFDRDRVHNSDIKKLLQWYNILIANGITDFDEELKPTEGDNIDNRLEQAAEEA